MGLSASGGFESVCFVGLFPSQRIGVVFAAEVTVVRRLAVDRAEQVELADDVGGLKAEHLVDGGDDFCIVHLVGAECLDMHADRMRVADGVGDLKFTAIGETGSNDVFGNPAAHVSGGAVDL